MLLIRIPHWHPRAGNETKHQALRPQASQHGTQNADELTWQPSLGNADARITFKARKHAGRIILCAVHLFENLGEGDYLTYEEIKNRMAISDNELQRTGNLQSLARTKFRSSGCSRRRIQLDGTSTLKKR